MWFAAVSAIGLNGPTRERISYVIFGWRLISSYSSSVRPPGLSRMRLKMPSLPMSCRREARIRSLVPSGPKPARSAIATATFATPSEWR